MPRRKPPSQCPARDLADQLYAAMEPVLARRPAHLVVEAVLHTTQAIIAACSAEGHEAETLRDAAKILASYAESHAGGLATAEVRGHG